MGHTEVRITLTYILNNLNSAVVSSADGAYITIDGKKCIDTSLGNGTHILGHRFNTKVRGGTLYGLKCIYEDMYGKFLNDYTGFERFVLCNTGAEATMRAVRIARAYTGRKKIAMFEGGWHGACNTWLDKSVIKLPYDESAINIIKKNKLALVLIEPVQGSLPKANREFLFSIRDACSDSGALFGFDEIISGFRLARGGARELFGIDCDIATYGKIAGGGFPIGIVAGKKEIMDLCLSNVRMGGTFSGNPASLSMGVKILSFLTDSTYSYLNTQGERLRNEIKRPVCGVGSFNRILFTDKVVNNRKERDLYEDIDEKHRFYKEALKAGLYIGKNGLTFISTDHTPDIITEIINIVNSI